eukprot:Colp12_sorted_trinity150504_noHs@29415
MLLHHQVGVQGFGFPKLYVLSNVLPVIVQEMNEKLDRVLNTVTSLKILLTIISNRTASDGSETPYMIVPNARGEMPGDNLPDITKLDHLVYMAAGALTGYCHFYGCNPTLLL